MIELVWNGQPSSNLGAALSEIFLWLRPDGDVPLIFREAGDQWGVASRTRSAQAAGAPEEARAYYVADPSALAVLPPGTGLKVDGGAGSGFTVDAQALDGFRNIAPPTGTEADLVLAPYPPHLMPLVDDAFAAARAAGARYLAAAWATAGGTSGLLVAVRLWRRQTGETAEAILQAAFAVVERHAPRERVRVVATRTIGGSRAVSVGMASGRSRGTQSVGPTCGQSAGLAVGLVGGAIPIALGQSAVLHGTARLIVLASGCFIEALVVLSAIVVAAANPRSPMSSLRNRRSGEPFPWITIGFAALLVFAAFWRVFR